MTRKTINLDAAAYDRLEAHKRGGESFSEALDRILEEIDSDWRTHAGFLTAEEADELEEEIEWERDRVPE